MDDWGISAGVSAGHARVMHRQDRIQREEMMRLANQREDTAIQRRVADAQAAGIHPLFALGASPGGGTAMTIMEGDGGDPGGVAAGIAESISAMKERSRQGTLDEAAAEMQRAQIEVLKSEAFRNNATAQSMLARGAQAANASQDGGTINFPTATVVGGPKGSVETQPLKVTPVPPGAHFRSAWGFNMKLDPRYAMNHAQLGQDRYGEPGEWAEGAPLYVRDISHTVGSSYRDFVDDMVRDYISPRVNSETRARYGSYGTSEGE